MSSMIESLLDFKRNMCWGVRRTCLLEVGLSGLGGEEVGETIGKYTNLLGLPQ